MGESMIPERGILSFLYDLIKDSSPVEQEINKKSPHKYPVLKHPGLLPQPS